MHDFLKGSRSLAAEVGRRMSGILELRCRGGYFIQKRDSLSKNSCISREILDVGPFRAGRADLFSFVAFSEVFPVFSTEYVVYKQ